MDGKISGHTTRTMKHNGRTYEKGATVSLVIPSGASEGANLELRSGTFSGDITPISLEKASV